MSHSELPSLRSTEVIRAFEKLGWSIKPGRGRGSHTVLGRRGRATLTVPQQTDIRRALLARLIQDAGVSVDEFKACL